MMAEALSASSRLENTRPKGRRCSVTKLGV